MPIVLVVLTFSHSGICFAQAQPAVDHVFIRVEHSAFSFAPDIEELFLEWPQNDVDSSRSVERALVRKKAFGTPESSLLTQLDYESVRIAPSLRTLFQKHRPYRIERVGHEEHVHRIPELRDHFVLHFRSDSTAAAFLREAETAEGVIEVSGPLRIANDMNADLDPYFGSQWNLQDGTNATNAYRAWTLFPNSNDGVEIAIHEDARDASHSGA